jgi:sugar (pentulose or hexulose) kinase
MTRERIFVLDVGKTNVKAALFDGAGGLLFERSKRNAALPGPPYPHADVEAIWSFCLDALRAAAAMHDIDAIVVTTHGATAALIGESDLVLPILDYEYRGIDTVESAYAMLRAPFSETLSPVLPGGLNLGRQIAWQSLDCEREFLSARHLLMYPQYWTWRLSGVPKLEATSLGAHTDLWQPRAGAPSSTARGLGLVGLLPPMARAYEVAGTLKSSIARTCGLRRAPDVLVGIHDSNASILPHLAARRPPFTVVSTGTWVILFGLGLPLDGLAPERDQLANIDVEGRPIACARFMGGREYEIIAEDGDVKPAQEVAADLMARGVYALPGFAPGSGPFAQRQGSITGFAGTAAERAALATLYIVMMTDYGLDLLGAKQGDIVIEGSFTANALFAPFLAALRPNQAVLVSSGTAGTARGAAMLANWPASAPPRDSAVHAAPSALAGALAAYRGGWRYRAEKV